MPGRLVSLRDTLFTRVRDFLLEAPWIMLIAMFRRLYGFKVEGTEKIPPRGPFILALREPSLFGMLASGWMSIVVLKEVVLKNSGKAMSYMQEELFRLPYFRNLSGMTPALRFGALIPHSAGRLGLSLLDGYQTLREGGIVILNPEGDSPWDGRPLPLGRSLAWLALRSGVPIVPAVCSIGAYDIWPRWRARPYLRGRLGLRVGTPFTVCDAPLGVVEEKDLAAASAMIAGQLDRLCYGPGGLASWTGEALYRDVPVEPGSVLGPARPARVLHAPAGNRRPAWRRGMAQVLWRCPVCRVEDGLVHAQPWLKPESLRCGTCGTRWAIHHIPERDYRLEIVDGPRDLVGLDMALSTWYDEMKRDFVPTPITVDGVELRTSEQVYLAAEGVALVPHRPNPLFAGWTGREPPAVQPPGKAVIGEWASIGSGRLVLTSQRLLWQNSPRELDFDWRNTNAIFLWLVNTLALRYGSMMYRFNLGEETGLKWLTYAGVVARQVARQNGQEPNVTSF